MATGENSIPGLRAVMKAGPFITLLFFGAAAQAVTPDELLTGCLERDGDRAAMDRYRRSQEGEPVQLRGELRMLLDQPDRPDLKRVAFLYKMTDREFLSFYGFVYTKDAGPLERGLSYDVSGVIRRVDHNLYGDSAMDAHRCDGTVWIDQIEFSPFKTAK